MANLIITVIAIALVAVASLMGAYYGGSAFLNNQSAAQASTAMNQGQQLAGAWQAYLGDNLNTVPSDVYGTATAAGLSTGPAGTPQYIAQWPQIPQGAGEAAESNWGIISNSGHYYAVAPVAKSSTSATPDTNASSCARINKTATGTSSLTPPSAGTLAALVVAGNNTFGCALNSGITFTYLTNSATGGNPTITPGALGTGYYVVYYELS
jgi:hypothetical protein